MFQSDVNKLCHPLALFIFIIKNLINNTHVLNIKNKTKM